MKTFIAGIAMILLYSLFIVFQSDYNLYQTKLEEIKMIADDCASAAMLYYDERNYENGYKVFNYAEGHAAIGFILSQSLDKEYWKEKLEYRVAYLDDSGYCTIYDENQQLARYLFNYGEYYQDPLTLRKKMIIEPIVIVTIDAGKGRFRLAEIQNQLPSGVRSSGYGYRGRSVIE